jgi:hypothetical protein
MQFMNTKLCKKCGEEKGVELFHKCKSSSDGLQSSCKECQKKHYKENREKILARRKKHHKENREEILAQQKKRYKENREEILAREKKRYEENREKISARRKKRYKENREKILARQKKYREERREEISARQKKYCEENREEISARYKKRMREDPMFRLSNTIRSRTRKAFKSKGWTKDSKTFEVLGCSQEMFIKHLENQFTKGMTFENFGEWHIDHIIPLSSAKTPEELNRLAHYTNLQPLWAEENLSKGAKIVDCQPELLLSIS